MTTAIKRRRGTTTQHSTFTGLEGEITIDTTKDTAVVHDGATAGGRPLLREDLANNTEVVTKTGTQTLTNKTLTSPVINTPTGITKSDISLGNVDNTSDATKNAATATLTNKTITLGTNTITGTVAQFQAAVTDGDFATLAGTETLTNKAFNGSLGATTPSTIAGTTITSSALTSGRVTFASTGGLLADSANLTFDGTTLSTVGLTTTGNTILGNASTDTLNVGNGDLVKDASGNVGLGIASPSAIGKVLNLYGGANIGSSIALQADNGAQFCTIYQGITASDPTAIFSNNGFKFATATAKDATGFTERMRLDSSGNLGIGVTPSAWSPASATSKAIQITGYAALAGYPNEMDLSCNSYFDGTNYKYLNTNLASYYAQTSGKHQWFTAPSGTAGNAITFTQAMTLDNSGNLGLGTTSPAYNLTIGGGTGSKSQALIGGSAGASTLRLDLSGTGTFTAGFNNSGATVNNLPTGVAGMWMQQAYPVIFGTNATERMRIDSAGNLGIGTASPDVKLQVSSASLAAIKASITSSSGNVARFQLTGATANYAWYVTDNANYMALYDYNASAERMRIDTSGNLLVGTTSTSNSAKVSIVGGSLALNQNSAGNAASIIRRYNNVGSNGIQIQGNSADTIDDTNPGASILVGGGALTDTYEGNIVLTAYGNTAGGTRNNITFQTRSGVNTVTERARIDSSGNLLVNTTSVISAGKLNIAFPSGTNGIDLKFTNASNNGSFIGFFNSTGGLAGVVSQTGATTVAYTTSSDYRLKENIEPMVGALATVQALKPVTYNWKEDGSNGQGFIAHELQSVIPDCVVGEKDATREEEYEISPAIPAVLDEEGNEVTPAVEAVMGTRIVPVYQGIDTSFLVATLTAAIQEQQAMIDELKAKVAALEAA